MKPFAPCLWAFLTVHGLPDHTTFRRTSASDKHSERRLGDHAGNSQIGGECGSVTDCFAGQNKPEDAYTWDDRCLNTTTDPQKGKGCDADGHCEQCRYCEQAGQSLGKWIACSSVPTTTTTRTTTTTHTSPPITIHKPSGWNSEATVIAIIIVCVIAFFATLCICRRRKRAPAQELLEPICPDTGTQLSTAGSFGGGSMGIGTATHDPQKSFPISTDSRLINIGSSQGISVTAEAGIEINQVLNSKHFEEWAATIAHETGIEISKIHIQSLDMSGSEVRSTKIKIDGSKNGKLAPGLIFMRGGTPAILVILKAKSENKTYSYALIVRQPCVAVCASSIPEMPLGVLDDDGNFVGSAAKRMYELSGIEINESSLINMTQMVHGSSHPGMYPSCGGSAEYNPLLLYRQVVSDAELKDMQNKLDQQKDTLLRLELCPLDRLWRMTPDAKALSALCLYEKLMAAGRLEEF
jgi:ADP-sugar diphosphatase